MLVRKTISLRGIFAFAGNHLVWLVTYMSIVAVLYRFGDLTYISIPWLPVSLIGTSVAFYLGFKNSQAYDRMWEARKIWGGIVNSSRMWGSMVLNFVDSPLNSSRENQMTRERLIRRHIAWLYTLREQLLIPTQWEHVSLGKHFGSINVRRREKYGTGQFADYLNKKQEQAYFFDKEKWETTANPAAQIFHIQSEELAKLKDKQQLDMFYQIELQKVLNDLCTFQGQAERIKKYPFPRQYANLSFIFNTIFIFLLPLGIVAEFAQLGELGVWLMIPFATIVGWVYVVMELIGDYSENPFEGLMNDIPMLAMCRGIEIDLLQMMGETDLPPAIQPINDILM